MLICVNNTLLLTVCCAVVSLNMSSVFRTNLPKEVMMFPDFPFDSRLPSFLTHWDVQQYLDKYCKNHDITPHIKVFFFKREHCVYYLQAYFTNCKILYTTYSNTLSKVSHFLCSEHMKLQQCSLDFQSVLTSLTTG